MGAIRRKSLDDPDAIRELPLAVIRIVRIGSHTIGYGVEQPGWRWSTHMGPAAGTPSCSVHHVQIFLSGRFAVRMDDGEEVEFGPLEVGDIPPGHDAWVVGEEPVHILDFAGSSDAHRHAARARADRHDPAHDRYRRLDPHSEPSR